MSRAGCALAALLVGAPLVARAEAPPEATALFDQGIKDMRAGKTDLACKELSASLAAYPDSGTKGALAECDTKLGKLASAWSLWRDLADTAPTRELRADAAARARRLEPRMPRFRIELAAPLAPKETVTVAGQAVVDPTLPVALPLDPGPFTVTAEAPGYTSWSSTFQADEGATTVVPVPALVHPGDAGDAPDGPAARGIQPPRDDARVRDAGRDDPASEHRVHRRVASADASAHRESTDREPAHSAAPVRPVTQPALWLDAGPAEAHRSLSYGMTAQGGTGPAPAPLGSDAFTGVIEGEVYPWAFGHPRSLAAGLGIAASFGEAVSLSVAIRGTSTSVPIDEGQVTLGVRYRFVFGASSVALGASYWARHDVADRSGLQPGTSFDAPDVDYAAIAPGVVARLGITPNVGVVLGVDVPLMLSSGPITTQQGGFGLASISAIAGRAGVDVALAPHYALRFAVSADTVQLAFHPDGAAAMRGVASATDTMLGATAMFVVRD